MLGVNDNTAMAQGVGGAINFTGQYHTNGAVTSFGSVEGYKTLRNNGKYDDIAGTYTHLKIPQNKA